MWGAIVAAAGKAGALLLGWAQTQVAKDVALVAAETAAQVAAKKAIDHHHSGQ